MYVWIIVFLDEELHGKCFPWINSLMYIGEVGRIIYSIYMMKYLYIILKKWFCPVLFTWIGDNGIMLEVMGEKVIDSYIVYDYVNEMPKIMCILGYFEMS